MALTDALTVMGLAERIDPETGSFGIRCLDDTVFDAFIGPTTVFWVLTNLDGLDNDRVPTPEGYDGTPAANIRKYLRDGRLIVAQGVRQTGADGDRFDVRTIRLVSQADEQLLFEGSHWWLTQTARLADQWLDSLFGDKRDYRAEDFVKFYRTDLKIDGIPDNDDVQECAVLSRLIYGFSAAYLLTGQDRYRQAAAAGVGFQRDAFRSFSNDGKYCFWAHGRRQQTYGTELLIPSVDGDDSGSIPMYEQIYALAGMALYYRISLDPQVLTDIAATMAMFNAFYLDDHSVDPGFPGHGGWFSHIDYSTLRPDRNQNPANDLKKNWNSVGDHIPAYLINVVLALDPLPEEPPQELVEILDTARSMLVTATDLILAKFTDPNPAIPYVNERFFASWEPDHTYSWQQNRAVIGHNFKIAWNLTRVANYLSTRGGANAQPGPEDADRIKRCREMARRLLRAMTEVGIDQIRGGCYDTVQREPSNGQKVEFAWLNTKDFWQQEQAILAYLIVFGHEPDDFYLTLARRTEAYWNLFFLDRVDHGVFFRVTEDGLAVTDPNYNVRGGHSDASGYHCFELNFLSHIYNRSYVPPVNPQDSRFCLYFQPSSATSQRALNVLPDAIGTGFRIASITVNGVPRRHFDPHFFQVKLEPHELDRPVVVEIAVDKEAAQ
jgi:mannose/cellobiose epimerase-like protein (N-acyl-D-glucosamine 2-epimerase family)